MKKNLKHKGVMLIMVLIITLILFSVIFAVNMLSKAHSEDIIKDINKSKVYYISRTGLEAVYAGLNEDRADGGRLIESAGVAPYDYEKHNIIPITNLEIKTKTSDGSGDVILGYAKVYADLKKSTSGRWYYRIVSTGRTNNSTTAKPEDSHTLTMFVFKVDPNNPKIYEGDITTYKEAETI